MPERATHTDVLRAGRPLRVGPVTLLPIERVVVRAGTGASSAWFSAGKEPYAVVLRDEGGVRAVAVGPVEVSLDELRATVPGLDDALAAAARAPSRGQATS